MKICDMDGVCTIEIRPFYDLSGKAHPETTTITITDADTCEPITFFHVETEKLLSAVKEVKEYGG